MKEVSEARKAILHIEETALEAAREAKRIHEYYMTRAQALRVLLDTHDEKAIAHCWKRLKKECPSVLPS